MCIRDSVEIDAQFNNLAFFGDTLSVENIEFCGFERRRDLVLDDFAARMVAENICALFDLFGTADVDKMCIRDSV